MTVAIIVKDHPLIPEGGMKVLKKRYLDGPDDSVNAMFKRASLGNPQYEEMMQKLLMLPNSPTLFNAGKNNGCTLSACFTFTVGDYMLEHDGKIMNDSIIRTREKATMVAKAGGGVGYYGGFLRAKNSLIRSVHRKACGPIGVLRDYQGVSDLITQGGKRELAQMFVLPAFHQDVEEFIDVKATPEKASLLSSFNISVSWHDEQIKKAWSDFTPDRDKWIHLWNKQCEAAWATGCPGMFFHDTVNRKNMNPHLGLFWNPNPSLRAGTRVLTDKGVYPIELLDGKDITVPNLNGEMSSAKCFLSGKNKRLYKLVLTGGREFYATAEHKWPVMDRQGRAHKVRTDELRAGDYLPSNRRTSLPFGTKFTAEDGFFVGWMIGDGSWTTRSDDGRKQIGLALSEEKAKCGPGKRLRHYIESMGSESQFSRRKRDGSVWYEVAISHDRMVNLVEECGFTSKKDGLPSSIWCEASEEFRRGLIDGLLSSDGTVVFKPNGSPSLKFTTCHEAIARDLMDLLGFYGVKISLCRSVVDSASFPNGKVYDREYVRYDLQVQGFDDIVHLRSFLQLTHKNKNERLNREFRRKKEFWNSRHIRVVSVEATELYENVWDISVYDTTHCFTLSGVVTGNCGEAYGRNNEACNLLSLVAARFVNLKTRKFNMDYWAHCAGVAINFLDDILSANCFPHPDIINAVYGTRRLGMGIMGWADTLALMGIKYDSHEARSFGEEVWAVANDAANRESIKRADVFGPYPSFSDDTKGPKRRNESLASIAPNGSIGLIAGVWGGIEPYLTLSEVERTTSEGMKIAGGMEDWVRDNLDGFVPDTCDDISVEGHVLMQAAFQKYTDLGVSKTINMPEDSTVADVSKAYKLMYDTGCNGGTIFRKNCRPDVVLREKPKSKSNVYMEVNKQPDEVAMGNVVNRMQASDVEQLASLKQMSETMNKAISAAKVETNGCGRRKLPKTRKSMTHKFLIADCEGYLTAGLYDNGEVGEIFIRCSKVGSTMGGMLDAWAMTFSTALQYGSPLASLIKLLKGHRFEPNGMTDNPDIRATTSIMDYVVRWLEQNFLSAPVVEHEPVTAQGPGSGCFCPECDSEMVYQSGCLMCMKDGCRFSRCG